ncbi:MAG: 4a-hydroxytetrahydrobiopterin dehydratase [Actinomycetota bacterium]
MESETGERHCESCEKGTTPVTEEQAEQLQRHISPDGERSASLKLYRYFEFRNFRDAFGFATRVALLAEAEGHHPDFEIGWGRVALTLTTHASGGLTENDFIMAEMIDHLL